MSHILLLTALHKHKRLEGTDLLDKTKLLNLHRLIFQMF